MKAIKIINTIVVALPLLLSLTDYLLAHDGAFLFYALLFTMVTGAVQVILGVILAIKFQDNIHYKVYLIAVVGYFFLGYIADELNLTYGFSYFMFTIPACLALYLSVMIYKIPTK
ncbi:hypothetical protein P3875_10245 [Myroides sp. JBRI-B21084]|uniref:hypothetical protein n=1 Tax=Myroides sp. JBRI-B21084 TaxID=3119977 RepID=UPI0026E11BE7|nr:hypothetical protein [Paenimyroides cloacae]WKW46155.1 hypothetical protein P3875_10245 [Paenimyroides cloacae]